MNIHPRLTRPRQVVPGAAAELWRLQREVLRSTDEQPGALALNGTTGEAF